LALLTDVLVVNAGSTGLKLSVVDSSDRPTRVDSIDEAPDVNAVGHRVVHGGERFLSPTLIDDAVARELKTLVELAPLHNAPALAAIHDLRAKLPDAVHVAVFDTSFHQTIPEVARTYALPKSYRDRGIRRFGFHGLSVEWAAEQVPVERLVVCHLGGGVSVTAVADGRSIDTTMGFTPLEGVPMGTRAGSVDPGALVYLLRHGITLDELDQALEHESGLVGLAGTEDVAELTLEQSAASILALDLYSYRIAQAVAAMTAALGGIDALVFTAGVGEHSASVRTQVCARLAHLGVALDEAANVELMDEGAIHAVASRVPVHVVHAGEEIVVARAVRALLETDVDSSTSRSSVQ
jgi:acetate kinase